MPSNAEPLDGIELGSMPPSNGGTISASRDDASGRMTDPDPNLAGDRSQLGTLVHLEPRLNPSTHTATPVSFSYKKRSDRATAIITLPVCDKHEVRPVYWTEYLAAKKDPLVREALRQALEICNAEQYTADRRAARKIMSLLVSETNAKITERSRSCRQDDLWINGGQIPFRKLLPKSILLELAPCHDQETGWPIEP